MLTSVNWTKYTASIIGAVVSFVWLEASAQLVSADDLPVSALSALESAMTPAGPATYRLAYKFRSGQVVHYSCSTNVDQTLHMEVAEPGNPRSKPVTTLQKFVTTHRTETGSHLNIVSVDAEGRALIEPVVDRTRMRAKLPDKTPEEFDSDSTGHVSPAYQAVKDSMGRPIARFLMTPWGEFTKATIVDSKAPAVMREAAEKLTARSSKLIRLPQSPIKIGETWREDYYIPVKVGERLVQPYPIRRIYELVKVSDGIAYIKFRTIILKSIDDSSIELQLIQATPSGTVEFDLDRGFVLKYVSKIDKSAINGKNSLMQVLGETKEEFVSEPDSKIKTASN